MYRKLHQSDEARGALAVSSTTVFEAGRSFECCLLFNLDLVLNLNDPGYIEECSTALCPECQHKVNFDVLAGEVGVFKLGLSE